MLKLLRHLLKILGIGPDRLVGFIGEALPQPLSSEEEAVCLEMSSSGDVDAKNMLIEHNLRLVVYLAKKFDNSGIEFEDLVSVGTIGLIKAVNSFSIEKNIKLATYASRCIENEILMHLRKAVKQKHVISLDEPLNVDSDGNELLLGDILGTESDMIYRGIEKNIDRELLYECMYKLNKREQQIVNMRFGLNNTEERTQKEVADLMGISQSYISRLEKKIISRLKKEIIKLI